jgi:DNA-binding NarL/FixJ family response regulator
MVVQAAAAKRIVEREPDRAEEASVSIEGTGREALALRSGASGFLLKDAPAESLIAGIRVVADGEALLAPSITRRLIDEFARGAGPAAPPPGLDELTPRELDVFKQVARGLSNAEIASELIVSETTVKTHVARMLMKLGLRDRVQTVVLAYEAGIVTPGAEA